LNFIALKHLFASLKRRHQSILFAKTTCGRKITVTLGCRSCSVVAPTAPPSPIWRLTVHLHRFAPSHVLVDRRSVLNPYHMFNLH